MISSESLLQSIVMHPTLIKVQKETFDLAELNQWLGSDSHAEGAIVTFTGLVRELAGGAELTSLFIEHYPGMTERALEKIVEKARSRWPLGRVALIHRIGALELCQPIVFVGVSSPHRKDAFEASQFLMDYLKRDAPFWKKEITTAGEHWVEQKQSDLEAADQWDRS